MKILNQTQLNRLAELRAMALKHESAWKRHATFGRSGGSSATPEQQAAINAECGFDFTNELRAELETLEFIADPPTAYFAYPSMANPNAVVGFMGNRLADITQKGREFRSNTGDTRQSFRAIGINGVHYVGTIYGTYLRMRRAAAQP